MIKNFWEKLKSPTGLMGTLFLAAVVLLSVSVIDYFSDKVKDFDDAIITQVDDKDIRAVCINGVLYYKLDDSHGKVAGISVAYDKRGRVMICD